MKRFVEKKELAIETTVELSSWIGIVTQFRKYGVILYIGDAYHIIIGETIINREKQYGYYNRVCGGREFDGKDIPDTLNKWDKEGNDPIEEIYCFDTFRELMEWFTPRVSG